MSIVKRILGIFAAAVLATVMFFYISFLALLPKNMNQPQNLAKIQKSVKEKSGLDIDFKGFKFITKPNLTFYIILSEAGLYSKDKENLANIKNLNYHTSVLNLKGGKLDIDYIFADINLLKRYYKPRKENNKSIDISLLPLINVKSGKILFSPNTYADIKYIKSKKHLSGITTNILAQIINPYTKNPVTIGEKGAINYKKELNFDKFSIDFNNSEIYLSGNGKDLSIKGKDLPAKELKEGFLYFYKLKHPNKKNFIENFSNFKGTMDVDLKIQNGEFFGNCITHNLGADFSTLKIPVFLPETVFKFNKRTMTAQTKGTFGTEPVTTDVAITGIATDKLDVLGTVQSNFTNRLVKKYYPNVAIQGTTPAKVTYHTHNNKVDVFYYLTIPKGNNLLSAWGDLNNTDRTRRITMHTQKQGNPMIIKELEYCAQEGNKCQKLLYGDGLIDKQNGKYTLYNLNLKSNGKIPIRYIKSFLRDYTQNGTFDADLKLDFIQKNILGSMNLYNVSHDNFLFLKNTNLNIENNRITLKTDGTFYSSPIRASLVADNKIENNKINIRSIDIHLNSLFLHKGKLTYIPETFKTGKKLSVNKVTKKKKPQIVIEQGRAVVDKIYGRTFDVYNVNIQGSLRNNIAHFIIPQARYAKGILSAKGIYDVEHYASDIQFFASDINSNEVATRMFNLPDHIAGNAYATLHVITKNKLNNIKAKATFAVADGYLPKIGNREFMLGKSKSKKVSRISKFIKKHNIELTLSKITNIDFSKPNIFHSNLYGSFDIDNEQVKNARVFSKSDYLGLYIEGNYNIETENGNINIFGKRNKTQAKKIRIFKIPLNLIYKVVFRPEHSAEYYGDKVKQIPEIKAGIADEISIFRVSAEGNLNKSEKLKVTLKDIR